MKRSLFGILSLAALLATAPTIVHAEDASVAPPAAAADRVMPPPGMGRGPHGMHGMSPEKREEMRARMKAKFESLPPEKQDEIKAKMEERREKMKNMTPEQREEMRKKWREERRERGGWGGPDGKSGNAVTHGGGAPITTK